MAKGNAIELIVRGVCVRNGRILLCHGKKQRNTYLPGGHIDPGENARFALEREIREEMGLRSKAGAFLGAVEHSYHRKSGTIFEINLLFMLEIPSISPSVEPPSAEKHIEFKWVPLTLTKRNKLEPSVLCTVLSAWLRKGCKSPRWASTIE